MATVTYVEHDGTAHVIDVPAGLKVMEGAVSNGIPGIDADCGGECSCATCHVYVDGGWLDALPPMTRLEDEMLDMVLDRRENSRLSCRLVVDDRLDGLVVRMPQSQF
jgi:2Fe-2S ferredoxin